MNSPAPTSTSSSTEYEKKVYTYIPVDHLLDGECKLDELLKLPESEIVFANHGKKCAITPTQKKIPTGDINTYIKGVLAIVKNVVYLSDSTVNGFPLLGVKFTRSPKQIEADELAAIAEDERSARIELHGDKFEGMDVDEKDIPVILTDEQRIVNAAKRAIKRKESVQKRKNNMSKIFKIYTIGLTDILSNRDLTKGMFTQDLISVGDKGFNIDPALRKGLSKVRAMREDIKFYQDQLDEGMLDEKIALAVGYTIRNLNEIINPTPQLPKYPHPEDFLWLPFQFNLGKDTMTAVKAVDGNKPDWRLKADGAFFLNVPDITVNIGRCRETSYRPGYSKYIETEKDRIKSISDQGERKAAQDTLKLYVKKPKVPKTVVAYLTAWINNVKKGSYIHQETATADTDGLEDLDDLLF